MKLTRMYLIVFIIGNGGAHCDLCAHNELKVRPCCVCVTERRCHEIVKLASSALSCVGQLSL